MRNIKTYGKFLIRRDFEYRFDCYIQIGECKDIIGACILNSPDKCNFKDKEGKFEEIYKFGGELLREIDIDDTMNQLLDFIKEGYGEDISGILQIYYLVPVRSQDINNTLEKLQRENLGRTLLNRDFESYKKIQKDIPFTLIGWGCDPNEKLRELKEKWLNYLDEYNINYFGVQGSNSKPDYLQPLQKIKSKKEWYIKAAVEEFNKQVVTVTIDC